MEPPALSAEAATAELMASSLATEFSRRESVEVRGDERNEALSEKCRGIAMIL